MVGGVLLVVALLAIRIPAAVAQTEVDFGPVPGWIAQVVRDADANQDPYQALNNLRAAQAELDRIVASFPASRAAVRIALGDPSIRQLKLAIPRTEERLRRWEAELAAGLRQGLADLERAAATTTAAADAVAWDELVGRAAMLAQRLQHPRAPAIGVDPLGIVHARAVELARGQAAVGDHAGARDWAARAAGRHPEADAIRDAAVYELAAADAELALREGRWSDAETQARQGLLARPGDERLTLVRDRAEVERLRREIRDAAARELWGPIEELMRRLLALQSVPRSLPLLDDPAMAELASLARRAEVENTLFEVYRAMITDRLDEAVGLVVKLQGIAADDPRLTTLVEQVDGQILGQGRYFGARFRCPLKLLA